MRTRLPRLVRSILLAIVAFILVAVPVLAYTYRAQVSIVESDSIAYPMLPITWDQNNTWLANNGYMTASTLDTRVETLGGLLKPWMVVDDKTLTSIPVQAGSQNNLYFTTGNTAATSMDIIAGHNGWYYTADAAALEPANNFEFDQNGYIDTSSYYGNQKLIYKQGAYVERVSSAGNITAGVISAESYDLGLTVDGAYQAKDVSDYVSPTANGVLLEVITDGTQYSCAFRKTGSTDARYYDITHQFVMVGLDANQTFEYRIENVALDTYIRGYTESTEWTYNTNATDLVIDTFLGWTNKDVSTSVPAGADGIIVEVENVDGGVAKAVGLRKNGSTDARTNTMQLSNHFWAVIGLDANRIFQYYATDTNVNMYLVGYTTSGCTLSTNATDLAVAGTGNYEDDTTSASSKFAIIENTDSIGNTDYAVRIDGSTADRYQEMDSNHGWAFVETSYTGDFDLKASANNLHAYLIGYANVYGIHHADCTSYTYSASVSAAVASGEHEVDVRGIANSPQWATGDVLHFDGTANSNVNCGAIYNASAKLWVSLWFKLDGNYGAGSGSHYIWGKFLNGTNYSYLYLADTGKLTWTHTIGGVPFTLYGKDAGGAFIISWVAGTWYHVLLSVSNVNGVRLLVNNGTASTDASVVGMPNGGNFVLGDWRVGDPDGVVGYIQNCVVGTDELTPAEETALYNGVTPGDETGCYYIDEGTGVTIVDYGSLGADGTAGAATSWATSTYTAGTTGRLCDFTLQVDTSRVGENLKGVSVPDNICAWEAAQGNVLPYTEYDIRDVASAEVINYDPITMIIGDALPDRTGAAQNATFIWGENPVGVDVTLGSMVSSGQTVIGITAQDSTNGILPVVGGTDWNKEPDVTGTLLTSPFRPLVTMVSDNTTLSERQVWVWYGIILVVFVAALVGSKVKGHHGITGFAVGAVIIFLVVYTIWPIWGLIFAIASIVGGLISERSPSL